MIFMLRLMGEHWTQLPLNNNTSAAYQSQQKHSLSHAVWPGRGNRSCMVRSKPCWACHADPSPVRSPSHPSHGTGLLQFASNSGSLPLCCSLCLASTVPWRGETRSMRAGALEKCGQPLWERRLPIEWIPSQASAAWMCPQGRPWRLPSPSAPPSNGKHGTFSRKNWSY